MAETLESGAQNAQSLECKVCKSKPGYKFTCDQCHMWFCPLCVLPRQHNCASQREAHATTTSKARPPALGSHEEGKASNPTPIPKPPPQRKPLHFLYQGTHPNKGTKDNRQHNCRVCSKLVGSRQAKPPKHLCSNYMDRPQSPDLDRPLSVGTETTPSPDEAPQAAQGNTPRATTRLHKAQGADRKASRSSAANAGGTNKQPRQSKHAGGESKKSRTKPHHQDHSRTDSEEYAPMDARATSSKAHTIPDAQPTSKSDKAAQDWEGTAEDGPEIELTHTYRIAEKVFVAVSKTIQAGYKLDHHRTTWGLSQINISTALQILSSIPHASYTNPQQYIDRCIEDAFSAQSTQQHIPPQPLHEKQELWTAHRIAKQVEQWAYHPTTLPAGLHTHRPGAFRLTDVMSCWGKREGLTAAEVTRAIQAHSNATGNIRFMLSIEDRHTVIAVVNTPPIGQAEHNAQATKPRFNPPKAKRG